MPDAACSFLRSEAGASEAETPDVWHRPHPVLCYHEFMERALGAREFESVLTELSDRYAVDLDAPASSMRLEEELCRGWRSEAPGSIRAVIDRWAARALRGSIGEVLRDIGESYARSLAVLVPLLVCFVRWGTRDAASRGFGSFRFLARDGLILWAVYRGLFPYGRKGRVIDLTRNMLGIPVDETDPNSLGEGAPSRGSSGSFEKRVSRELVGTALFDIGYYGTIFRRLMEHSRESAFAVYLFSSKNPNLYGFTNAILSRARLEGIEIDVRTALVLTDTIEAVAKPYGPPFVVCDEEGEEVVMAEPKPFAVSVLALYGLHFAKEQAQRLARMGLNPLAEWVTLDRVRRIWCSGWDEPFLLREPTPTWSQARSWIRTWNVGPVIPAWPFELEPRSLGPK